MSRRTHAQVRAARDAEIADWLDRWTDKARGRRSAETCVTVAALAASVRAGLIDAPRGDGEFQSSEGGTDNG